MSGGCSPLVVAQHAAPGKVKSNCGKSIKGWRGCQIRLCINQFARRVPIRRRLSFAKRYSNIKVAMEDFAECFHLPPEGRRSHKRFHNLTGGLLRPRGFQFLHEKRIIPGFCQLLVGFADSAFKFFFAYHGQFPKSLLRMASAFSISRGGVLRVFFSKAWIT